ncbi:MAG: TetR/AcrR family transcriptional regulator [Alcaligenaceae bacterium]|nr:MAG: TetR/AcrR family transcriptional regulator [Alcaligenaceae bacterium]
MKEVAQRLFAARGIDGVTIKDIVSAAGQKNNASLHYHFGSKEALIAELLLDGAKLIDAARQQMLEEILARGVPIDVRTVVEALVRPVIQLTDSQSGRNTYMRFIANLQMNHRAFFRNTLGDRWNAAYRRCLDMLRELLVDVPAPLLEQRISIMGIYSNALFSAKEIAADEALAPSRLWKPDYTLDNIIDTLQAVLEGPVSHETLSRLPAGASRPMSQLREVRSL